MMRTSTGVGHEYIHPKQQIFQRSECAVSTKKKLRDPELQTESYHTTTQDSHCWKYQIRKDTDVASKSGQCDRQHFMRNIDEKLKLNPWSPLEFGETEYTSQYVEKEVVPLVERELAPARIAFCRSRGLGRDEQPAVPPGVNSYAKHLDPYVSTTHLDHARFTDAQIYGVAKQDHITFYSMDMSPGISMRQEPVYDNLVFSKRATLRILPKAACHVPGGMESEMQGRYVHPYRHEFSSKTWDCGTEFPVTIPIASPWETQVAPNMYCTEYCHIGTGWPVRAAVA